MIWATLETSIPGRSFRLLYPTKQGKFMKYALLATLLFGLTILQAESIDQQLKDKLDETLQAYVEDMSPGMAVGIVRDGEIVYQNFLGYSNLEHAVEIGEKTRFNIASNGKQYTALAILKLLDEGKLNLEDDIRKYLPDLYKSINEKITISNLLTHSSGIRDVYDLWALKGKTWWKLFVDNGDALELIQSQEDLNFKPGSDYLYSNSNYILLTEIIKQVSGERFSNYAAKLFKDLGMNNTSFLTNYMAVISAKARPYGNWNGWREYPAITGIHGDGALFSTLGDQLQWEKIIQAKSSEHISQSLIDQSQQTLPNVNIPNYGYGLMFGTHRGLSYAYHDGNTGAYNATFLRFPETKLSIVVLSNNGNIPTNYLAKQIANMTLNLKSENLVYPAGPETVGDLESISDVVGDYKTDDGTIIKIVEKDGSLYRKIYQRDPVKLINETGNLFHYETNKDLKIAFTEDEARQWRFTIYLSSQAPNVGVRLPVIELNDAYKKSLDGRFYNDETDTEILINFLENNTYIITKNGRERKGELILKDFLRMNSYEIEIHRDANDMIDGLVVNNRRIRNVMFTKKN